MSNRPRQGLRVQPGAGMVAVPVTVRERVRPRRPAAAPQIATAPGLAEGLPGRASADVPGYSCVFFGWSVGFGVNWGVFGSLGIFLGGGGPKPAKTPAKM